MDGGYYMDFVQMLGSCPAELAEIIGIIKWVINIICWAIPIILIVLCIFDIAKIVTAGNIDDKLKKEVTGRITTRIIFAVILFLVPTIVGMLFQFIPVNGKDVQLEGVTWRTCWFGE